MKKISDEILEELNQQYGPGVPYLSRAVRYLPVRSAVQGLVVRMRDTRYRLLRLAELKAPNNILWNEAYWLNPNLVPVKGKAQLKLWDVWKDRDFVKIRRWTEKGREACYAVVATPEGEVLFCPTGRWGPFIKEL